MQKFVLPLMAGLLGLPFFSHTEGETALLASLDAVLVKKPVALHSSLIPGFYGVLFPGDQYADVFVDQAGTVLGGNVTGYLHLTGPNRGKPLTKVESEALFIQLLRALPRNKLITEKYGTGARQIILLSAYDCPSCRQFEATIEQHAQKLNATIYLVPTSLDFEDDAMAPRNVTSLLCSKNPAKLWNAVMLHHATIPPKNCSGTDPSAYAYLYKMFPSDVVSSVPTAITEDGHVYTRVITSFSDVFRLKSDSPQQKHD